MKRTIALAALALAGLAPLAACSSSDKDYGDSRHILTVQERDAAMANPNDEVTKALKAAGFAATWTNSMPVSGQGKAYSLTYTQCAAEKSPKDCDDLARPNKPHVVRDLAGEPASYGGLQYKRDTFHIQGGDGQYDCTPADEAKLTADALRGLPAEAQKLSATGNLTIAGVAFRCTK